MFQLSDKNIEYLYEVILSLKTKEECHAFFEDICTIKELQSMSQRMVVAKLLDRGRTFNEIVEETGASSATISRVNKALNYGTGYRAVLDKNR